MRLDIIENINQIILEASKISVSQSVDSEFQIENGHFIITLKFFKFLTSDDVNNDKREVEIMKTINFIDFEGFNNKLTDCMLNDKQVSYKNNAKNFSILSLKNLIESIATLDLTKYSELNSILASLISTIFKIPNTSCIFFGFIDQNEDSILESTITLEILNKCKTLNIDYFFDVVHEMELNYSNIDNKYPKEEFHVIQSVVYKVHIYI